MIEVNAFLAVFPLQILAMSVLHPLWISRYVRGKAAEFPAERFRQLYPGVNAHATAERYLKRYRILNTVIALLGVWLWVWSFNDMRSANWDDGAGEALRLAYFMLQLSPLLVLSWYAVKYGKLLKKLPASKRTAVLQRRGLFDFVSPFAVFLAVLGHFLFVAYVLYIAQHPFPGFAGPFVNILIATLGFAMQAFAVYKMMYGTKGPETHEARMYAIGLGVKACVYTSIFITVSLSIDMTLKLLDLPTWQPVAGSVHAVIFAILINMCFTLPPRRPEPNGFGASPVA
jgi:hypothetical protein